MGASPGSARGGPGRTGRTGNSGGTATRFPATVRSGSPANCEKEGRQADDPRTDQKREQREEGGAMTRFGTQADRRPRPRGGEHHRHRRLQQQREQRQRRLAPRAPAGSTQPGSIGAIPAAGTAQRQGRHDHLRLPGRQRAELDPAPGDRRVQLGLQHLPVRVRDVAAALLRPQRHPRRPSTRRSARRTRPSGPTTTRRWTISLKPWKWSDGTSPHRQGPALLDRRDHRGGQGVPGELGRLRRPASSRTPIASMSAPNANTLVINLKSRSTRPGSRGHPRVHLAASRRPSGPTPRPAAPTLDYTQTRRTRRRSSTTSPRSPSR